MPLLVVESPTKIKTLRKLVDGSWSFAATRGHLYDLPRDEMGIDDGYEPRWVPQGHKTIRRLREAARGESRVYVASDPDREGEAIAWQVEELVLEGRETTRLRLESITSDEVDRELDNPGRLDPDRVRAQWARRLLDRLAGYKISPLLMRAFKGKKLSAGRVQSAVLDKIVERWEEVESFTPETFYRVEVHLTPSSGTLSKKLVADLVRLDGEAIGTGDNETLLKDGSLAEALVQSIRDKGVRVLDRERSDTETHPAPAFDSAALIATASSWFGWPASRTMSIAQSLYEKGLITYHRSDSTRVSREGCKAAAAFVNEAYGKRYHNWRGGGGGDQEGHEAVRAQSPFLRPEDLNRISGDYKRLYSVIWQRYVQSQMIPARWDRLVLGVEPEDPGWSARLEASLRSIREWGFYRCRVQGVTPPPEKAWESEDLQRVQSAEAFACSEVDLKTSETSGPSLYTEGGLIGMMKREGIGRPSTYGSTIKKLRSRGYIRQEDKTIVPTTRGRDVNRFLNRAVPAICDVTLTKSMEASLDEIARGEGRWKTFVSSFDRKLENWLNEAKDIEPEGTAEREKERLEFETCPVCDAELYLRDGSHGTFVHCGSDDCDFTSDPPAKTYLCPECNRHMVKHTRGLERVYRCLRHPDCPGRRPVGHPSKTFEQYLEDSPSCPECEDAMVERKGRWGVFWGCVNYPECEGTRSRSS